MYLGKCTYTLYGRFSLGPQAHRSVGPEFRTPGSKKINNKGIVEPLQCATLEVWHLQNGTGSYSLIPGLCSSEAGCPAGWPQSSFLNHAFGQGQNLGPPWRGAHLSCFFQGKVLHAQIRIPTLMRTALMALHSSWEEHLWFPRYMWSSWISASSQKRLMFSSNQPLSSSKPARI